MGRDVAVEERTQENEWFADQGHGNPLAPVRLFLLRVRHRARLLAAAGVGMLVAVVLLSAVPVYLALDSDVQVQELLASQAPSDVNVEVFARTSGISAGAAASAAASIRRITGQTIGGFAPTTSQYVDVNQMVYATVNGKPTNASTSALSGTYAQFFSYDMAQIVPRMRVFAGRLPKDTPPGGPVEAMAIPQAQLHVGDTVTAYEFGHHDQVVTVRISGIWYPKDEHDPFWNGRSFKPQIVKDQSPVPPYMPLFLTRNGFFSALGKLQPSPGMEVHVVGYTQPALFHYGTIPQTVSGLKSMRAHLNGDLVGANSIEQVSMTTRLDGLLGSLTQQHALSTLPLYIVVAQVAGLALFFVMAMAGLLIESDSGEIAVLRSRGASVSQLVTTVALQGLLPAIVTVICGPLLAAALAILLIRLFVTSASVVPVQAPSFASVLSLARDGTVILVACAGALLGILAMALAAFQALRRDVLAYRLEQGRASASPFWQRYYLDLVLAILCVAGYLELGQFGGLAPRMRLSDNGGGTGPLLLLAPALLLLAGGLVTLRVLPLVASLGVRLAARSRGATGLLAFAQVSRSPSAFRRLTLLLVLVIGMALFALTFQASVAQNAADRAAYQAGGDIAFRLDNSIEGTGTAPIIQQRVQTASGITAVTPLGRIQVNGGPGTGATEFTAIGLDPATFATVAYWRHDYANQPLSTLMSKLKAHAGGEQAGQSSHPVWAIISRSFADSMSLAPGDLFTFTPEISGQNFVHCIVGAVVENFPTMYPDGSPGYVIMNLTDLVTAFASLPNGSSQFNGPNEFWLRTTASPETSAAINNLVSNPDLFIRGVTDRTALLRGYRDDPLATGMTGLLIAGVFLALALAILGTFVQADANVSERFVQFSVLRTLGVGRSELTGILLREQVLMYAVGIIGGTLFGALMATATLPLLVFGSAVADASTIGVPPYQLTIQPLTVVVLYGVLSLAFVLALIWQRMVTLRSGLSRALRLGDD